MMNRHPILYSFIFVSFIIAFLFVAFLFLFFLKSDSNSSLIGFGDIAIVRIEGPLFESDTVLEELIRYKKNKSIKAIVLRIDSPGGAVAPSQEIFEEVKKLKQTKKVVISMGTVAASGAYYIASAGDKIIASKGTITGSIGVIMESLGFDELAKWAKLENRIIKSGRYKDVGSPFRKILPEEKEYLQSILDDMYAQFKKDVAEQRKIPLEKMDELAEGKVYTGEQAQRIGLIDGLGTFYDAIDEAKKLAGLPDDAKVIWPKEDRFPYEWLKGSKSEATLDKFFRNYFYGAGFPMWIYRMPLQQ